MKQALIYSLKVWLTTSIVGSLVISLIRLVILRRAILQANIDHVTAYSLYHMILLKQSHFLLGSFVIMIPLCVALYYCIILFGKRQTPDHLHKPYLSVVGGLLALLPFALLIGYFATFAVESYSARVTIVDCIIEGFLFSITSITSIWFYKLSPIPRKTLEIVEHD